MTDGKMNGDNALHVPVEKVDKPCEVCGSKNYPNLQYRLVGITGVMCRKCLDMAVADINAALRNMYDKE